METLKNEYEKEAAKRDELKRDIEISQSTISVLSGDVHRLSKEVEAYYLEKKWGPEGTEAKGVDAEKETIAIVKQVKDVPELMEDVVSSLRQRQAKLNVEITDVKSKLAKLDEAR